MQRERSIRSRGARDLHVAETAVPSSFKTDLEQSDQQTQSSRHRLRRKEVDDGLREVAWFGGIGEAIHRHMREAADPGASFP